MPDRIECPVCDGTVTYEGGTWKCDRCKAQWLADGKPRMSVELAVRVEVGAGGAE